MVSLRSTPYPVPRLRDAYSISAASPLPLMDKTIRIQDITQQDSSRKQELHNLSPSQRMEMLFSLINRTASHPRLQRVATVRHVPF